MSPEENVEYDTFYIVKDIRHQTLKRTKKLLFLPYDITFCCFQIDYTQFFVIYVCICLSIFEICNENKILRNYIYIYILRHFT